MYLEKIDTYRSRLLGYNFSTVVIEDYPIDIACDVFTRINTGGTELTLFEIMVAKTFDNARGFDLAEKYQNLIDSSGNGKDTGADQPYDKLKRALRAKIDESAWSALYTNESIPFEKPSKKGKIAVKVIKSLWG